MLTLNPPLPEAYLDRMRSLMGDDFHRFIQAYSDPPVHGLRTNTLKIHPDKLNALTGFDLTPVLWCSAGFYVDRDIQAGKHPYHLAGLYYLQEPTAMLAAELLDPQPGDRVLDLAAAPGGKSTHLASLMKGQGLLVSNEIHPRRVWELAQNIERWGAANTVIINETPERMAEHFGSYFDRILVDAPCSGEGMFRKNTQARLEWTSSLVQSCAIRQGRILELAALMVYPGGYLLYSTCTFSPEENEGVIAGFLDHHPHYEVVSLSLIPGFSTGKPEWLMRFLDDSTNNSLSQTIRLWPHQVNGEGHFFALMRRTETNPTLQFPKRRGSQIPSEAHRLWENFSNANLSKTGQSDTLCYQGTYLYQCPEMMPELSGLRVIHPGLWLGQLKNDRFMPAHSLSMTLNPEQVKQSVHYAVGDWRLATYIRGETFPSEGDDGWVIVCVDQFPLGWGRRVNGVMKNFFPHGLRRQ